MSHKENKPTQEEVDSLAAFIEAAEEFQQEPFCGPDEKLTFGYKNGKPFYHFGDRFHFRSALVSFRRIWLNDEASNFNRIINIISKYNGDELCVQMWMPLIRQQHRQTEKTLIDQKNNLTNKQLVDLWLNAVFAHNNIAQKRKNPKRMDRIDFEHHSTKLGHDHFEYSFRIAVRHFGLCYRNLLNCVAKQILAVWKEKHGLTPSFQIGLPFGQGMEEVTKGGVVITRKASTQYWNPESPRQKLDRLLSRHEFQQLQNVLHHMKVANLVDIINHVKSYGDLIITCGFKIELSAEIDINKIRNDMISGGAIALIPCGSLLPQDFFSAIYADKHIVTQQGAIDFFETKFQQLKKLLAK